MGGAPSSLSISGDVFERRIIRITLGATAIEGRLVRCIQGHVVSQTTNEIRIGDEGFAESNQIGFAAFDRLQRQTAIVSVVRHPGRPAAGRCVGGTEACVVEGAIALLVVTRSAGGAFDDVHIGERISGEAFDDIGEERLRVRIEGVVGGGHGRDADPDPASADLLGNGIDHLEEKAGAVLDRAAIGVRAFIGAGAQELVDQIAVGSMDLDAVESGFDRGPRGLAVILDDAGDLRRFERLGSEVSAKLPVPSGLTR